MLFIHASTKASLGIRQSPRGDRDTDPTFGPSGIQDRLNCWEKNRRINTLSHFLIVEKSYESINAKVAIYAILEGENPYLTK